jgi:tetratricopeptide (TPR) repeat protein
VAAILIYPAYIAFVNEFWGGPSQAWRLLNDSNADWAQQLKATHRYLDAHGIKDCRFIYFAGAVVDTGYYGIPCKPLPTMDSIWMNEDIETPPEIDGTLLISAGDLSGFEFGPGKLNPYEQFKTITPVASIDYGVFVYQGSFQIPLAAALSHSLRVGGLLEAKEFDRALSEAQEAATLAPDSAQVQQSLGDALAAMHREDEARSAYQQALQLATTIEPEFQQGTANTAKQKLDLMGK